MKRWFVYGVAISIMAATGSGMVYQWQDRNAQKCNNATRMADLFTIAQMIEDYKEEAGTYPFQPTDDSEAKALLATRDLTEAEAMSAKDKVAFYDEIERVIGKALVVRLADPQKDADAAFNFYQYRAVQDAYYLTAILSEEVPQSIEVGKNQYKVELSSVYDAEKKIYPFLQVPVDSILATDQMVAKSCS